MFKTPLLANLISALFRQKILALLVGTAVFGFVVIATVLLPRRYEARMKVLVKNERADLIVSPVAGDHAPFSGEVSENQVNSEIELLTSNDLLSRVVQASGLTEFNSPEFQSRVRELNRNLKVVPIRKADIIQVSFVASSPASATSILRELSVGYLDAHIRAHSTSGSQEFFAEQREQSATVLSAAENRLRAFRRQEQLTSVAEQRGLILRKVMDEEAAFMEADASLADVASRLEDLRHQISAQSARIATQSRSIPNQYSVERLNTLLVELENRRTLALTKFLPSDRNVTELEQEIKNTRIALDRASMFNALEESTDLNPLRSELEATLSRALTQQKGLTARLEKHRATLSEYRTRLDRMEEASMVDQDLERQIKRAEENFLLYARKEEEARIADSLDKQKIANVVIVEQPIASDLPVSPNLSLNLALGSLTAAFAAILAAIVADAAPVFHVPADLEAETGLTVIATIPFERA
jgi:uncharacterized protein involved in exopolysaccharide biosynthesis